jgi:hypothetical protein
MSFRSLTASISIKRKYAVCPYIGPDEVTKTAMTISV